MPLAERDYGDKQSGFRMTDAPFINPIALEPAGNAAYYADVSVRMQTRPTGSLCTSSDTWWRTEAQIGYPESSAACVMFQGSRPKATVVPFEALRIFGLTLPSQWRSQFSAHCEQSESCICPS